MGFEAENGVIGIHAVAVVGDGDQALSGAFNFHCNSFCVRIESVFHQLLHHRCRTFNDLSRGNLVADMIRQDFDDAHLFSPASLMIFLNSGVFRILSNAGSQEASTMPGPMIFAARLK